MQELSFFPDTITGKRRKLLIPFCSSPSPVFLLHRLIFQDFSFVSA